MSPRAIAWSDVENIVLLVLSLAVTLYLIYALLRPERF
jgi:K+-transporting ATPase KdpF subunit